MSATSTVASCEKLAWTTLEETSASLHTELNLNEMNAKPKSTLRMFRFTYLKQCSLLTIHKSKHSKTVNSDLLLLQLAPSAACLIM